VTDVAAGPADAMPLTEAERQGLLLPVLTRAELNRAEAENITKAMSWLFLSRRRLRPESVTDEEWLKRLHRRMYGDVWAWAGEYRTADRNPGVPYWQVRMDMRNILNDVRVWLGDTSGSRYSTDECAVRFGYRMVVVHPFANGNGRWSRLASDALSVSLGGSRFTWGRASLTEQGTLRRIYIAALQTADTSGDFRPLLAFARS
jgi:Fic-DOC domain mobile mystery protein B